MDSSIWFIGFVIFLAFIFDFTNGFHDAANSIATIVTTGVLKPRQAVIWAAFFNFIAFLFFSLNVAHTSGAGLVDPKIVDPYFIFATLAGAILWNIITWFYGIPSSSSHALIGGLAGAALVKGGINSLVWSGFIKIIAAIILSPLMGLLMGLSLTLLVKRVTRNKNPHYVQGSFRHIQLISSAFLSLSHGGNDAQKTMGIIAVLLSTSPFGSGYFEIPLWVVISCQSFIALGTLFGGWRIVETMGKKIAHLNALRGTCAEFGASIVIFTATHLGIPISTTHSVTGSIAGVGISQGLWGAEWRMMRVIFVAWVVTIPLTASIAGLIMLVHRLF